MLLIIFLIVMLIRVVKLFLESIFMAPFLGSLFYLLAPMLVTTTLESAKLILQTTHGHSGRILWGVLIGIKKCNSYWKWSVYQNSKPNACFFYFSKGQQGHFTFWSRLARCVNTQCLWHSRTYAKSRFTVVFWMMHPMSTTKCWLLKPIQILYYSCFFCANFRETYTMTRQGFEKDFFKESIMGFVSLDVIMMPFS